MVDFGTSVASAWSSGLSMWAVAAILGIGGRLDWVDSPSFVQRPWVIAVALAMAVAEVVVDKFPYVDSTWDAVHTALRPLAGALLLGSSDVSVANGVLLLVGGLLALSSHAAKASTRLLVNASPEPLSNLALSLSEDGLVAVLMALALGYPRIALAVTLVLTVGSIAVVVVALRVIRRAWRKRRRRRQRRSAE
ncbi:MAG TPA: DUF4126 domain-containing protein [Acidimicrobiales bacterium]